MKTLNRMKQPDVAALKDRYLDCIGLTSVSTTALEDAVEKLIGLGISRKTLVDWAVRKGYSRGSAANLLTRIFKALGLRERQPGAGRKPSRETLELLEYARARYGKRYLKVLRAAWRTGKAQANSGSGTFAPQSEVAEEPPVAPPLRSPGTNNGPIIRRNGSATKRIKKSNSQNANMNLGANNVHIIKGNGHATNRNGVGIHPQQSFSKGIAPRQKNQTRIIRL